MATSDLIYASATGRLRYRPTDSVGGDGGLRFKMAATVTIAIFGSISAGSQSYAAGDHTLDWVGDEAGVYTGAYGVDTWAMSPPDLVTRKGIRLVWGGGVWTLTLAAEDYAFGSPPTNGYATSVWTCPTLAGIYELDSTTAGGSGSSAVTAVYVNALAIYDWSTATTAKRFEGFDTDASLTTAAATVITNVDADSSTATGYTYIFTLHSVVRSGADYIGSAVRGYDAITVPSGATAVELRIGTTRYSYYPASGTIYVGLRTAAPTTGTECRTHNVALYDYALGASTDLILDASGWAWGAAATKYLCLYMSTGSWSSVSLSSGQTAGWAAVISRLVFV